MNTPVADAFAARIAELQQQDRESQQRTQETLQRLRQLVDSLEALSID
jgi:signal transduction histidine kinase